MIKRPSLGKLREVAQSLSFSMSDEDLAFFLEDMQGPLESYETICKRRRENPSLKRPGCPVAPE